MTEFFQKNPWFFYTLALLLLVPALFFNLGYLPLNFPTDEPTRANVALEMMLSGNYITPTINGDFYYNKPPLYNWIIIAFYKMAGNTSEFTLRLPVVISLLLFGLTIFLSVRRHSGTRQAFIVALLFITSGRILFWDSFLGLIDICFSWLVYSSFMLIYLFHQRKQLLALFMVSYLLTAITFMMKGLPSLVFQGITLLVFFSYNREFKKLFSWKHFAGIGLFLMIVGTYYAIYIQHNSLEQVFTTLFRESEKRTVINYGWSRFVSHLFTFPVEMFYHFFPWSVLWIYFIRKGFRRDLLNHPFLRFNFLIFIYNIIIYWTSPESYPRYIFMLFPPLFTVLVWQFFDDRARNGIRSRITEWFLMGVLILGMLVAIPMPLLEQTSFVPHAWLKASVMFLSMTLLAVAYYKLKEQRMVVFVSAMLVLRIGFDWFIIPPRFDGFEQHKLMAIKAAQTLGKAPLYIYKNSETEHATTFYINQTKQQILARKYYNFNTSDIYYLDPRLLPDDAYETLYEFTLFRNNRIIRIVRLNEKGAALNLPYFEITY